jgi:hypothetical protein
MLGFEFLNKIEVTIADGDKPEISPLDIAIGLYFPRVDVYTSTPFDVIPYMGATFHFWYSFIPIDLPPQWNLCFTSIWCTSHLILHQIDSCWTSRASIYIEKRAITRVALASVAALALSGLVVIVVYRCYHERSLKEENSVEDKRELIL